MSYQPHHLDSQQPCPYLPVPASPVDAEMVRRFRKGERGADFYEVALLYAHSLWLRGFPAKSLLLINRALGADLRGDEAVLGRWPLPYAAVAWIMRSRGEGQFIGNPRRHYQHLATRMVEPRRALRTWRAWACWHLASAVFSDYPVDEKQIAEESVVLPDRGVVLQGLEELGLPGEPALWERVERGLRETLSS